VAVPPWGRFGAIARAVLGTRPNAVAGMAVGLVALSMLTVQVTSCSPAAASTTTTVQPAKQDPAVHSQIVDGSIDGWVQAPDSAAGFGPTGLTRAIDATAHQTATVAYQVWKPPSGTGALLIVLVHLQSPPTAAKAIATARQAAVAACGATTDQFKSAAVRDPDQRGAWRSRCQGTFAGAGAGTAITWISGDTAAAVIGFGTSADAVAEVATRQGAALAAAPSIPSSGSTATPVHSSGPSASSGTSGVSGWWVAVIVAGVVVLAIGSLVVLRRRRRPPTGSGG
jgi:hypothetical protein